ncbi:unnamed protein product [Coccothraustes coccothraustes]
MQVRKVRDEYESQVQNLFVTCVHLKGKSDVYCLSTEQPVLEISSEEQLQLMQEENTRLSKLVCKLKALNCWKQNPQKAQLSSELRDAAKILPYHFICYCLIFCKTHGQEALKTKKECLNAALFERQLMSVRKAHAKSQADTVKLKKWLCKLADELQCQVDDLEAAVSQRNVTAGTSCQHHQQYPFNFDPRSSNDKRGNTLRPKTVPSKWKERTACRILLHLNEKSLPTVIM